MNRVKLDLRGLEEVAKSGEMHRAVNEAADRVADGVRSQGIYVIGEPGEIPLPVVVRENETTSGMRVDRASAAVQINHASGQSVQAKHGALSKAASAAGLKLKGE